VTAAEFFPTLTVHFFDKCLLSGFEITMNELATQNATENTPTLETAPVTMCPVCTSRSHHRFFSAEDHLLGLPGVFNYSKCEMCGTVFQNPRVIVEDLVKCYAGEYFTHDDGNTNSKALASDRTSLRARLRSVILHYAEHRPTTERSSALRTFGRLLSAVPPLRRRARYGLRDELSIRDSATGKCLEIGPGRGTELRLLKEIGWDAVGLDVDPAAAEVARRVSGCEVYVGNTNTDRFPVGEFDLIYMNHVLEHLPEIKDGLQSCFEWLGAGGRLVLAYPNPRSLVNRRCGRYSPNWDAPRHLVLPTTAAINDLLQKVGFSKARVTTCSRRVLALSAVARSYRAGNLGWAAVGQPQLKDRAVAVCERILVALRIPVGEEILVTAYK
jgi:SAM-dependent methyltransferase